MSKRSIPSLVLAIAFLLLTTLLLTVGVHARTGDDENANDETATAVFKIEGMTCGGCEAGVRMSVKKLDGIERVEASYEDGRAEVTYDPERVTAEEIEAAIEKLGYAAELVEPDDKA